MSPTRPNLPKTFEDLITNYYGRLDAVKVATIEDVVTNYYGSPRASRRDAQRGLTTGTLSLARDDGEVLAQKTQESEPGQYVVREQSTAEGFQEYVVTSGPASTPDAPLAIGTSLPEEVPPADEYTLDVLRPLDESPTLAPSSTSAPPSSAPPRLAAEGQAEPAYGRNSSTVEDDELAADMQAILSGQKFFDPATGKTVERSKLSERRTDQGQEAPPAPQSSDHAIFERIAQSMQYANAYDLGTIELENRFADFDRMSELQRKAAATKLGDRPEATGPAAAVPKVDSADFLRDLDAIRGRAEDSGREAVRRVAEGMPASYSSSLADWTDSSDRDAVCASSALRLELSEPTPAYARPMYDTGEHAQAGGDLYADQLLVGPSPGVAFSYGQLLAMADLYGSVDQMMAAPTEELSRLKALIDRSTAYYKTNKSTPSLNVSNDEWDRATGGRYLKLAEANYKHFSPNVLFDDDIARKANKHGNNRSAWETHHRRAIQEAQKLALAPENAGRSYVPVWPLVINAFGDHFLTDAFASGHLFNKEVMIAYFRANFFSGGSLTPAGKAFFGRVAEAAFVGAVAEKFSALETTDYPVCLRGWCLKWHPNINSASRFHELLMIAATQQPEKVANVAVVALHDRLNRDGIDVTNDAGDGTWRLTGDEFLNPESLRIMKKAVQQSVDNVNSPSIQASDLNFGSFFERVWRYVPRLTPASKEQLTALVREHTNPESVVLSSAAAAIVRKQVDSLIRVLVEQGKLKPA